MKRSEKVLDALCWLVDRDQEPSLQQMQQLLALVPESSPEVLEAMMPVLTGLTEHIRVWVLVDTERERQGIERSAHHTTLTNGIICLVADGLVEYGRLREQESREEESGEESTVAELVNAVKLREAPSD